MSYRLENAETLSEGVKRIAVEQIKAALEYSRAPESDLDDVIHETRVCFKKLRGLLRLIRYDVGDDNYKTDNTYFRDANRRLSSVRDNAALTEAMDKLQERFPDLVANDVFKSLRESLEASAQKERPEKKKTLAEIGSALAAAGDRVEKWPIEHDDFSKVGHGLRHVYKLGLIGFAAAREEQSTESLHEWRKQVKYLWYHVRLLNVLWPEPLMVLAAEIKTLSRYLSDDHDLALLRERVLEQSDHQSDQIACENLVDLIDQSRSERQVLARLLGERVYADKPRAFINRFTEYWGTWQSEKDTRSKSRDSEIESD
jgi:CHAD domain-containing protein